jgi:hypothetical protein
LSVAFSGIITYRITRGLSLLRLVLAVYITDDVGYRLLPLMSAIAAVSAIAADVAIIAGVAIIADV